MNNICYIVGAGEDCGLAFCPKQGDLVIAADGGYEKLKKAGIRPDLVIGDFDSLGYAPMEDRVITLPTVKDVTDTWAAVDEAQKRSYREFHLYGCTGGRVEHTIANIQMAASLAQQGLRCLIFGKEQVITALSHGALRFSSSAEGFLSVFSHTDRCTGVSLTGLKYELDGAELSNRFPLGVSNEFVGKQAIVRIEEGIAVVVYHKSIDKCEFID